MKQDPFSIELTPAESLFASANHYLVEKYLRLRKLPFDEWYDVVIFRYIRSVKRWFALPYLREYSFERVAFLAMRSAVGNEFKKQGRRIQAVSLDEIIPGSDNLVYADMITYENLDYINYGGDENMEIKYDVTLPENVKRVGKKSDEAIAIDAFLMMTDKKNMCFVYTSEDDVKRKHSTIQSYRRLNNQKGLYEIRRSGKCIYIIRAQSDTKKVKKS